jgi:tetratricopeptide (TPR) repeat protein
MIVLFSIEVLSNRSIVILPLSVPKTLSERGYTPEVAATRLRDALHDLVRDANTRMKSPNLALRDDLPDFVIPSVGLSLATLVSFTRTFFRADDRQNISGEVIISADKELSLRLRKNGISFHDGKEMVDVDKPDELIKLAAIKVADVTVPYLNAAVTSHNHQPTTAVAMAHEIIASRPKTDSNVMWAHVLIGGIYYQQGQYDLAIPEFREALQVNDRFWNRNTAVFASAINNIGLALLQKHQVNDAVVHFRAAISYDPDFGVAHLNLANALQEGTAESSTIDNNAEAQCERQRAVSALQHLINSDPLISRAHRDLGYAIEEYQKDAESGARPKCGSVIVRAWNYVWKHHFDRTTWTLDRAIDEYRIAIKLDPHDADALYSLGLALVKKRKKDNKLNEWDKIALSDEANEAFDRASNLPTHTPEMRVDFANELHFRDKIDEANDQLRKAASEYEELFKLEPNDCFSQRKRANILVSMDEVPAANDVFSIKSNCAETLAARGFADFDAGKSAEAVEDFTQAIKLGISDQYGPYVVLWLNLARARAGKEMSSSELEAVFNNLQKKPDQWPLPIVMLFMDKNGDPQKIFDAVKANPDKDCEAQFYVGEWYLLRGMADPAAKALHMAADNCPQNYSEFAGARAELPRIDRKEIR